LDSDNSKAQCIFISGAYGDYQDLVNGAYEPAFVQETRYGRICYRKIGHPLISIEHHDSFWRIKDSDNIVWAMVAGACALESCGSRTWKLKVAGLFSKDESCIAMQFVPKVTVTANNCQSKHHSYFFLPQKTLEAENLHAQVAFLSGATGPTAFIFNGLYNPTKERNNGRVRYVKRENTDIWIEYGFGSWQVKRACNKGQNSNDSCEAHLSASWSSAFENFAGRCSWKLWIGSCWQEQHNMKLEFGPVAEKQVRDAVTSTPNM
jgi:hypothetical protein